MGPCNCNRHIVQLEKFFESCRVTIAEVVNSQHLHNRKDWKDEALEKVKQLRAESGEIKKRILRMNAQITQALASEDAVKAKALVEQNKTLGAQLQVVQAEMLDLEAEAVQMSSTQVTTGEVEAISRVEEAASSMEHIWKAFAGAGDADEVHAAKQCFVQPVKRCPVFPPAVTKQ